MGGKADPQLKSYHMNTWFIYNPESMLENVDFAVPADHRVRLKESETKNKYLDLVRELKKKLCHMTMTFILIVISALGRVTKGLLKRLLDGVEAIQTSALLRSARILKRVLEETCCHSNSSEKPSANASAQNSKKSK